MKRKDLYRQPDTWIPGEFRSSKLMRPQLKREEVNEFMDAKDSESLLHAAKCTLSQQFRKCLHQNYSVERSISQIHGNVSKNIYQGLALIFGPETLLSSYNISKYSGMVPILKFIPSPVISSKCFREKKITDGHSQITPIHNHGKFILSSAEAKTAMLGKNPYDTQNVKFRAYIRFLRSFTGSNDALENIDESWLSEFHLHAMTSISLKSKFTTALINLPEPIDFKERSVRSESHWEPSNILLLTFSLPIVDSPKPENHLGSDLVSWSLRIKSDFFV